MLFICSGCASAEDLDDVNSTIVSIDDNSQLNDINFDYNDLKSSNIEENELENAGDYVQIKDHKTGQTGTITTSDSSVSIDMTWSGAGGTTLYLYVDDVETSNSYSVSLFENYGSSDSVFTYNFAKEGTYVLKVDTGSHIYESNHLTYIYQTGGSSGNGTIPNEDSATISIYDMAYPSLSTITSNGDYVSDIAYNIVKSGDGFSDESLEVIVNGQSVGSTTPNPSNRLGNLNFTEDNEWTLTVIYTATVNGKIINAASNTLTFITRNTSGGNSSTNGTGNNTNGSGENPNPQPGEIQVIIRDANNPDNAVISLDEKYNVWLEYYVTVPSGDLIGNDLIIFCNGESITTISPIDKTFTSIGGSIFINESGDYVFTAKYSYYVFMGEQGTIESNSVTYHVTIKNETSVEPSISINIDDAYYPNNVTATVTSNIDGMYTIFVGENSYPVIVSEGNGYASFALSPNSYTAEVVSNTNSSLRNSTTFTVYPKSKTAPAVTTNVNVDGDKATITFNFPSDISNEKVTVILNGKKTKEATITNGFASVEFEDLIEGDYSYQFIYSGNDDYELVNDVATFHIGGSNPGNDSGNGSDTNGSGDSNQSGETTFSIVANDLIRGQGSPYDFKATFYDKNGNPLIYTEVNFIVNGNDNIVKTDEYGVAKLINNLAVGNYSIIIRNYATGDFISKNLTVVDRIIGNKNVNVDYSYSAVYRIQLFADNGHVVGAGEKAIITLNNVKYTVVTDKDGYATFKVSGLLPKTYTITAEYKGVKVSNKVFVKQILKAKNAKFKKSKKVKKYKVTLKTSAGKAITGKKITLKVKGKTYSAKTNKKGVATFKIKNLKKVGKFKATIQYVKTSIKKTIKVKK